ncbi:unnamed protein product [Brassica rapa subsp. narinosa]
MSSAAILHVLADFLFLNISRFDHSSCQQYLQKRKNFSSQMKALANHSHFLEFTHTTSPEKR